MTLDELKANSQSIPESEPLGSDKQRLIIQSGQIATKVSKI
jgi:hypothetical protein